ncbi:MAG: 3-dehydroquinate dehydratase [Ekhidna sp.]|nr:3-dehydroquinate dehydratase [Ekhidna sp.]
MKILVLNGPNLNLVGIREPDIYGSISMEDHFESLQKRFSSIELSYFQSNHEGFIIDKLHEVGFSIDGIVLNAGGLTHTSVALRDAIAGITSPVFEVHISNLAEREDFRQHSYITEVSVGAVNGRGLEGYAIAIQELMAAHN